MFVFLYVYYPKTVGSTPISTDIISQFNLIFVTLIVICIQCIINLSHIKLYIYIYKFNLSKISFGYSNNIEKKLSIVLSPILKVW